MDEMGCYDGCYDGWYDFTLIFIANFVTDYEIKIKGKNHNGLKEYIIEAYINAMEEEYMEVYFNYAYIYN